MSLAHLIDAIDKRDFEGASDRSGEALERTRDDPVRESEALYWSAVVAFRSSDDREDLTEGWNPLIDKFLQSGWAKRTGYIRRR